MRGPDTGRGQVPKWFFVRLLDPRAAIDVTRVDERKGTREFSAYAWMSFVSFWAGRCRFGFGAYRRIAEYARTLSAA